MSHDTTTTILGAFMAAGTAATPVLNGMSGTMHTQDYVQLAISVCMALFGFFTNRKGQTS